MVELIVDAPLSRFLTVDDFRFVFGVVAKEVSIFDSPRASEFVGEVSVNARFLPVGVFRFGGSGGWEELAFLI